MIARAPQHDYCPIVFIRRDSAIRRLKARCRYVNSVLITAGCDDVSGLEAPVLHHAVFEPARVGASLKLYRCVRHRPPGIIHNAAPHADTAVAAQPECRSRHRQDEQYEATVHGVPSHDRTGGRRLQTPLSRPFVVASRAAPLACPIVRIATNRLNTREDGWDVQDTVANSCL
jgi:hypothetical protein